MYIIKKGWGLLMKKTLGKRLLSGITSAALTISYIIPSGLQLGSGLANAATNKGDQSKSVDDAIMLAGINPKDPDGRPYGTFTSIDDVLKRYNEDYALGIASQFCVFLEGDFNPTSSDTEGRFAIGGNFISTEYEASNGDFCSHQSLDVLTENSGYAHGIINGERAEGLVPTSWNKYKFIGEDGTISEKYAEKRFWITPDTQLKISENFKSNAGSDRWSGNYDDYFYTDSTDFNVAMQFTDIKDKSEIFAGKDDQFEVVPEGETLRLKYTGNGKADTVYCNLDADEQELFKNAKYIRYEDIPELSKPRGVVDNDGSVATWDYAYIVVNVGGENVTVANNDVFTSINGILISKNWKGSNDGSYKEDLEGFPYADYPAPLSRARAASKYVDNNHVGVTSLLYNFYDATDLALGKNFQGTILAPKADAHDGANGYGHLSGALVAKSFSGGTEFGYRPFTGPISMLGLDSNYTIDVSKIDADDKTPLNGATFGLFPVENGTVAETPSTTFTIEEGGKINQPIVPGRYALKEIKAPKGYELNEDKVYYIEVTEGREETKDDIWTGGYVEDIEPVLYILDENLTQEELTANADRYVPAEKEKTVYTYKFEYNNDLGQMAWGAQNPPTGVKIDSMTLHYPGSSPTADVYTIGENGFEQPADNTVYVPAEGTKNTILIL